MKNCLNIDLSKNPKSISSIIENNHTVLDSCVSVKELTSRLSELFEDYEVNTKASKRLVSNVSNSKTLFSALKTIYDSMLYGSMNSVNQH